MLVESDELPTTSQPAPYRFEEAFEKIYDVYTDVMWGEE